MELYELLYNCVDDVICGAAIVVTLTVNMLDWNGNSMKGKIYECIETIIYNNCVFYNFIFYHVDHGYDRTWCINYVCTNIFICISYSLCID